MKCVLADVNERLLAKLTDIKGDGVRPLDERADHLALLPLISLVERLDLLNLSLACLLNWVYVVNQS